MKEVEGMFDYRDYSFSNDSSCYLRIYRVADNIAIAIATELVENSGPSITNSAEALWSTVVKEYRLDPERTYFVEHYDNRSGDLDALEESQDETFDVVSLTWTDKVGASPKWRHESKQEIEKLIGESLD